MPREEAIEFGKMWLQINEDAKDSDTYNFFKFSIEALEQETASKEAYDHEYFLRKEFEIKIDELQRQLEEQVVKAESILDKIKEDVVQTRKMYLDMNDIDWLNGCDYVLSVVDKYRREAR